MRRALALAVWLAGCSSSVVEAPPAVLHASHPLDGGALLLEMVGAAGRLGYPPVIVQPRRGRFAVHARFEDEHGMHVIAVECFRDGTVRVMAMGPRVENFRGTHYMPEELQREVSAFAMIVRATIDRMANTDALTEEAARALLESTRDWPEGSEERTAGSPDAPP